MLSLNLDIGGVLRYKIQYITHKIVSSQCSENRMNGDNGSNNNNTSIKHLVEFHPSSLRPVNSIQPVQVVQFIETGKQWVKYGLI